MSKPRQHLPAEERREVTVEAVVDLAADQNPNGITTAAIAERMGVTQGALFRHFPTKQAILQATMDWIAERLLSRVDRAVDGASTPVAALEAIFDAHVDFVVEHPGVPRMLFGQLQQPGATTPKRMTGALLQKYGKRLRRVLKAGRAQGALDEDLDVDAAAVLFIGMVQGLVMQSLVTGDPGQIRRESPGVFAIYLRGIGGAP